MSSETLKKAIAEAKRFLDLADRFEVLERGGPKQTGAIRRSSMDLTRALAELRRAAYYGN